MWCKWCSISHIMSAFKFYNKREASWTQYFICVVFTFIFETTKWITRYNRHDIEILSDIKIAIWVCRWISEKKFINFISLSVSFTLLYFFKCSAIGIYFKTPCCLCSFIATNRTNINIKNNKKKTKTKIYKEWKQQQQQQQ